MPTMRDWQASHLRVYRPCDNPRTLVTMPGHQRWPTLAPSNYNSIASATVPAAWISDNLIHEGITEAGIESADRCLMTEHEQRTWPRVVGSRLTSTIPSTLQIEPTSPLSIREIDAALEFLMLLNASEEESQPPQLTPLTMLAGAMLSLGPPQANGPPPLILSVIERDVSGANTVVPPPHSTSQLQTSSHPSSSLPSHVVSIMIQHAVNSGATCPITMEPLTAKTAAVTACGHVFDRDALTRWSADHGTCPECRAPAN
jgi:hypothetical protein